jgi:hypothetical protein
LRINWIVAALVAGSALTLGASMAAAPANADATGTVKAQTQRTTAPNLNSQDGVYSVGDKLTLVCSTPGENVKGYFSFNEPNGGWDNLWYRTSDNHYVADVDIETGTLKAVAPDCSTLTQGSAPALAAAPSGDRAAQALAWARDQMASNPDNPVECKVFVEQAYHTKFPGGSAIALFNTLRDQGQIHANSDGIPAGALVFTSDPRFDSGFGHVMLSEGNGTYLTANYYTKPKIREVPLNSNDSQDKFLGWAYAP